METQKKINYAHEISTIICERYFKQLGFKELPPKFWNDDRFTRHYRLQIIKANSLLKMYCGPAILEALQGKGGCKVYSLMAPWLDSLISQEQKKIDVKERRLKAEVDKFLEWEKEHPAEEVVLDKEKIDGENQKQKTIVGEKSLFEKLG